MNIFIILIVKSIKYCSLDILFNIFLLEIWDIHILGKFFNILSNYLSYIDLIISEYKYLFDDIGISLVIIFILDK
jgi:hypothetical protein